MRKAALYVDSDFLYEQERDRKIEDLEFNSEEEEIEFVSSEEGEELEE